VKQLAFSTKQVCIVAINLSNWVACLSLSTALTSMGQLCSEQMLSFCVKLAAVFRLLQFMDQA
jgi:hypothetical protein